MTVPVARRAGRVLLVDALDRVLLFRGGDPVSPAAGTWWFTPGGGLDEGESFAAAAARELREETGLAVALDALGEQVHTRVADFQWNGGHYRQSEEYFLLRVASHDVVADGLSPLERASFVEHRWWTRAELLATSDTVHPVELADLLQRLGIA